MAQSEPVERLYEFHAGSIRVAGKSKVFATGLSAFHEYVKGTRPVEFIFLGGNAGQQAFKACAVVKRELERARSVKIAFEPFWCKVEILNNDVPESVKDASGWRIVELSVPPITPPVPVKAAETAKPATVEAKQEKPVDVPAK